MGLGDLIQDDKSEDEDSNLKEFLESQLEQEPEQGTELDEDEIDVTDTIEVYENGKTWECPCGSGNGTPKELRKMKCAVCGKQLVDKDYLEREDQEPLPPKTKEDTSSSQEDDVEEEDHGFW